MNFEAIAKDVAKEAEISKGEMTDVSKSVIDFNARLEVTEMTGCELSESSNFDPDRRIDSKAIAEEVAENSFDPDKRVESKEDDSNSEIGTTSEERKEFANHSDGEWDGEPGDSKFHPNDDAAKQALDEYGQDGIEYKDGNPDFSKVSEATVEIDGMTSDRGSNFRKADAQCVKQWNEEKKDGRTDWTREDVSDWRSENRYSWHERIDMKTMDLVQRDVHDDCKHFGGVAECKRHEKAAELGGKFDE